MAIPLSGRFDYVAVIPADRERSAWLMDQDVRDRQRLTGVPLCDDRLVGVNPTLTIAGGTVTLTAAGRERASCQAASFEVALDLFSCVNADDVLHVMRTGAGGVGLTVTRAARLVLAVGAVTQLRLEPLTVKNRSTIFWEDSPEGRRILPEKWPPDTWVDVTCGEETQQLRERQEMIIGEYGVFIERPCHPGLPGDAEAVAIWGVRETIRTEAIASAKLLAKANGDMCLVKWSPQRP